ncbi:MAG TPA: hypothetical protein ENH40_06075 [Nitrospirae bacterium]|nr:hypothetical protein BMS3Bbin08_00057 [bacterium BMS3Bbin08]HDZ62693.1 hypothetical protein [Nitrospirota bacterium]
MKKKSTKKRAVSKRTGAKKRIDKAGVLKIPVHLDDFKWRKGSQDWGINFGLSPKLVALGQPLQKMMNRQFVIVCYPVDSVEETEDLLRGDDDHGMIEDLENFVNE